MFHVPFLWFLSLFSFSLLYIVGEISYMLSGNSRYLHLQRVLEKCWLYSCKCANNSQVRIR